MNFLVILVVVVVDTALVILEPNSNSFRMLSVAVKIVQALSSENTLHSRIIKFTLVCRRSNFVLVDRCV